MRIRGLFLLSVQVLLSCTNTLGYARLRVDRPAALNVLPTKMERMFESILDNDAQTGGAGGSSTLQGLYNLDKGWSNLRNGGWKATPPAIVEESLTELPLAPGSKIEFDVCVCGGTLGIFYAFALQQKGHKTCVLERNKVAGRAQEWNISRKELNVLVSLGLLTAEEMASVIGIEFNPVRVGFKTDTTNPSNGYEHFTTDVLNLGIRPNVLIALVRAKYLAAGGVLFEDSAITRIKLHSNGAAVCTMTNKAEATVSCRLIVDAMGNASPIVKQIRGAVEPDGICIVVGSCARGFDPTNNTYSDLIYTDTPVTSKNASKLQYFWEAFPAGSSAEDRTTYLFTYMDAKPERPSITEIVEDYYELMPRYQGKSMDDLQFLRFLYGCFPTYRDSPVNNGFDRVLQVGDASGIQSPLSFGGFGSLTRHIRRIVTSADEALRFDLLSREYLSLVNPYQPNLSACWMFQRAMSVPVHKTSVRPDMVTGTLSNSFSSMERLGEAVMLPFLQDVLQFVPLLRTLILAAAQDPLTPFKIVPHVGLVAMSDFFLHFFNMALYTALAKTAGKFIEENSERTASLPNGTAFKLSRWAEAWKFGSGLDYDDHH